MTQSDADSYKSLLQPETLRAFAKGELDEQTEDQIIALLNKRPKLQAKVAAISTNEVLERLNRAGSCVARHSSLVDQVANPSDQPIGFVSTVAEMLNVPTELADLKEYRIVREIGRGGMGVVYLAENLWMGNRKEVLKVLNEKLLANQEAITRFRQEIECTAVLDHQNIVRSYTVRPLKNCIVFAMEFVPGRDLHQLLSKNGRLPIDVACRIALEVCQGLQHAFNKKLVHRDIKPSNIMLFQDENRIRAKILDFGLARLSNEENKEGLTQFGTLLGTLEYISPEQSLNAMAADHRSDIYSLGCTLYHMLAGHPPFKGTAGELILAHSQKEPARLNLVRPEVSIELASVVAKMMAKDPNHRYQSPQEIIPSLELFLNPQKQQTKTTLPQTGVAPETCGPQAEASFDTSVEIKPLQSDTKDKDEYSLAPLDDEPPTRQTGSSNKIADHIRPAAFQPKSGYGRQSANQISESIKNSSKRIQSNGHPPISSKEARIPKQKAQISSKFYRSGVAITEGGKSKIERPVSQKTPSLFRQTSGFIKTNKRLLLICGTAFLGFLLLIGSLFSVLKIGIPKGTVQFRHLPKDAEVWVDGNLAKVIRTESDTEIITELLLKPGNRSIECWRDGIVLFNAGSVKITSGKTEIIDLGFLEPEALRSSSRIVWIKEDREKNAFIYLGNKTWREVEHYPPFRASFTYVEVANNEDYIEIYDPTRKCYLRLRPNQVDIKFDSGSAWEKYCSGKWSNDFQKNGELIGRFQKPAKISDHHSTEKNQGGDGIALSPTFHPQNGIKGQYYKDKNFKFLAFERIDPGINFNWAMGSPDPRVPNENFSIKWKGFIRPRYSEEYFFFSNSDDGIRVTIDGKSIIDHLIDQLPSERTSKPIVLDSNRLYPIEVLYFESSGNALVNLSWSSTSQKKETVPTSQLFHQNSSHPEEDKRTTWKYQNEDRHFLKVSGKNWVESGGNRPRYEFVEDFKTDRFVRLFDKNRNVWIDLRDTDYCYSEDKRMWIFPAKGGWVFAQEQNSSDSRSEWSFNRGNGRAFRKTGGKEWREIADGKEATDVQFVESARTDEYVELHDERRRIWIRLRQGHYEYTHDRRTWTVIETGKWTIPAS